MSAEDKVQVSDRAFLNVSVAGTTVTVNEKTGPIASVSAPADGKLRITWVAGQGVPETKALADVVYLANGGGNTPVMQSGAPAGTLEIWSYEPNGGALAANYEAKLVLKRVD